MTSRSNEDSVVSIMIFSLCTSENPRAPRRSRSRAGIGVGPPQHVRQESSYLVDNERFLEASTHMALVLNLPVGLSGSVEMVVGEQHTAPRIGSGRIRVLATPVM